MKKFFALGAAALALASVSTAASAQDVGDWVLSQWHGSSQYFPGVVTARQNNTVTVRFDDGTRENRPASSLRPYDWRVGSHIECRWTDGNWYGATITMMGADGMTLDVLFDDGDRQRTNTGRCRVD
jgi:hypothetical protein